jgi:peptidoglycan/LPS O-acetylase OafA/YrhL
MKAYRPDIDALRALSVALVVIFHVFPKYLSGGFIGVDVFFVISGYLITSNIQRSITDNKFSLLSFYQNRARRLYPCYMPLLP